MKKYTCTLLISALMLISCDKYLDIEPKGVRLLETIRDYDEWLNNVDLEYSSSSFLNSLDDRKDIPTISATLTNTGDKVYTWQPQFVETVPGTAPIWSAYYKAIYLFNTVINNVETAIDGTDQEKKKLKAEALLGRSYEYLSLVNLYAKIYDPNTANQDLAVPFVTSIDVTDPMPDRSTIQEIYTHIIEDITIAIPNLPKDNATNRFRGSVAAAYGVLARTYLYMGNYVKAAEQAQLALNNFANNVTDFTTLTDAKGIVTLIKRPDALYGRFGSTTYNGTEIPTLEFLKTFDTKDLRLKFYYTLTGDYSFTLRGRTVFQHSGIPIGNAGPNWGVSVAELHLIIAEAAARNNELTKACDALDQVRKRRFLSSNYTKFTATNQETVLQKVLAERGFEFAFCGLRWFDMRRLDAQGRMPTINRYNGTNGIIATLTPNSPRYTLQIPSQVMYFNPSWLQNP